MVLLAYSLLNFISAALIFFIQPLAAKTVLPVLGGAPFVWTGCMVFFQAVLLAGYIYAHILNTYTGKKLAVYIHLGLFLLVIIFSIPLDINNLNATPPPSSGQLKWLIGALAITLGMPFFVISATSPLTQSWFAATRSKWQGRPYKLYAASNLGSFSGLFAYPLLFEPFMNTRLQMLFVDFGFILLFALICLVGIFLVRSSPVKTVTIIRSAPISLLQKFTWIGFALVPSGLLYSVSTYISTDLISMPLLWVIPLAIYILSFVLVFGEKLRGLGSSRILHFAFAGMMVLLAQVYFPLVNFMLALHFLALFIFCLACHQKLYDMRPKEPRQLTIFYIFLSIGGVLGGLFNVFVAPNIFSSVVEYPIFIFLSLLIWFVPSKNAFLKVKMIILFSILISIGAIIIACYMPLHTAKITATIAIIYLTLLAVFICEKKPTIATICIGVIAIAVKILVLVNNGNVIYQGRNIFGISKVSENKIENIRIFTHGSTKHGIQRLSGENKLIPSAYYYGLNSYFKNLPPMLAEKPIAIVGEGAGTLVCYAKQGQSVDVIEINDQVVEIAEKYFTYIKDCPAEKKVYIGDGRVEMLKQPDSKYGIIFLDAFSSDSIPVHLITQEAVAIYARKLSDNGILFFNISNRYINLAPVLGAIADSLGYKAALLNYNPSPEQARDDFAYSAIWVAMAPKQMTLDSLLKRSPGWEMLGKSDKKYLWRDDYSNIIRSIIW